MELAGTEEEGRSIVTSVGNSLEYENLLKKFNVSEVQLSIGEMHDESTLAIFPHLVFGHRKSNCARQLDGISGEPQISFFFPATKSPGFVSDVSCDIEKKCFAFRSENFQVLFPEDYEHYYFGINLRHLELYFNELDLNKFNNAILQLDNIKFRDEHKNGFLSDLVMVLQSFKSQPDILKNSLVVKDISSRLTHSLYGYLESNDEHYPRKTKINSRHKIVKRTLRFIESKNISRLTIADIAKAAHVSIRSLEYAFNSVLNMTPKQYLVLLRLNEIRRELTYSMPNTTIRSVLSKYGVINQGRFSKDYFDFFGETPRQTRQSKA